MLGGKPFKIVAKTASYSLTDADYFQVFTTRGAGGAVTFTLPTVSAGMAGRWVLFINAAAQNMTVAATTGEMVTFNDLTANTVTYSTSSELIGGGVLAICDGTSWICLPIAEESQTFTVAT